MDPLRPDELVTMGAALERCLLVAGVDERRALAARQEWEAVEAHNASVQRVRRERADAAYAKLPKDQR